MSVLDDDFSVDGTLNEGGDGTWALSDAGGRYGPPRDLASLYEETARAEAAEARSRTALGGGGRPQRCRCWKWAPSKSCRRQADGGRRGGKGIPPARVKDTPSCGRNGASQEAPLQAPARAKTQGRVVARRGRQARKALAASEAGRRPPGGAPAERSPEHTGASRSVCARRNKGAQKGAGPVAQGRWRTRREAGPGEGAGGEHQGDRQEAVEREPASPQGGQDPGRRRGPGPVAVRPGLLAAPRA